MIAFPNGKINIGLQVLEKRSDGFHNLQTIFYPLFIKEAVEIITNSTNSDVIFTASGISIDGNIDDNLCVKAYQLLKQDFSKLPAVRIHLHKTIPMGAGLGGGSADAAFTLQLLNKKYELGLTNERLQTYALSLGSDCPFFIINKPSYATGRGELLEPISLDLSNYSLLLANPGIHINTGAAFSLLQDNSAPIPVNEAIKQPIETWKENILNDFETPVFSEYPEIKELKENLYTSGALYASMSGSGSSVYGIFEKNNCPTLNFPAHYFYKWV